MSDNTSSKALRLDSPLPNGPETQAMTLVSSSIARTLSEGQPGTQHSQNYDAEIRSLLDPNGPAMTELTSSMLDVLEHAAASAKHPWDQSELIALKDSAMSVITSPANIIRYVQEAASRGYPGPPVKMIATGAKFGKSFVDEAGDWCWEPEQTGDKSIDFSECEISTDMTWPNFEQAISAVHPAKRSNNGVWTVGTPENLWN